MPITYRAIFLTSLVLAITYAFHFPPQRLTQPLTKQIMKGSNDDNLAGSFFNPVPNDDDKDDKKMNDKGNEGEDIIDSFDQSFAKMMQARKAKPLASKPSTINGIPTKGESPIIQLQIF